MSGKQAYPVMHLLNAYTWAGRRAECAITSEGLNCTENRVEVTCLDCLLAADTAEVLHDRANDRSVSVSRARGEDQP